VHAAHRVVEHLHSEHVIAAIICEVQEATDLYVVCAGELFSTIVEVDLALYVKKDFHGPHSSTANPCLQLHLVGLLAIKKLCKLLQEPLQEAGETDH
jgi:hypothetical protein